jgi:hypothetical protein
LQYHRGLLFRGEPLLLAPLFLGTLQFRLEANGRTDGRVEEWMDGRMGHGPWNME